MCQSDANTVSPLDTLKEYRTVISVGSIFADTLRALPDSYKINRSTDVKSV